MSVLSQCYWPCRSMFMGAMLVGLVAGCGGGATGPQLGRVEGRVQIDGAPVANLQVYFEPADGPTAVGTTDKDGRYRLSVPGGQSGAVAGSNTVRIIGRLPNQSDSELEEIASAAAQEQGRELNLAEFKASLPPVVPEKYNEKSSLVREVKPGSNSFDFELSLQ